LQRELFERSSENPVWKLKRRNRRLKTVVLFERFEAGFRAKAEKLFEIFMLFLKCERRKTLL